MLRSRFPTASGTPETQALCSVDTRLPAAALECSALSVTQVQDPASPPRPVGLTPAQWWREGLDWCGHTYLAHQDVVGADALCLECSLSRGAPWFSIMWLWTLSFPLQFRNWCVFIWDGVRNEVLLYQPLLQEAFPGPPFLLQSALSHAPTAPLRCGMSASHQHCRWVWLCSASFLRTEVVS